MLRTSHVLLAAIVGACCFAASAGDLELYARIDPAPARAEITLHGAEFPYSAATNADSEGRFRFKDLDAGAHTVAVVAPRFRPGSPNRRRRPHTGGFRRPGESHDSVRAV